METKIVRPKVELLWFSTVDQGKQLEINTHVGGRFYSLATIVADSQDESLWLELYLNEMIVQVPLATIREALASAHDNVHSEAWYEENGHYESRGLSSAARAISKRDIPDGTE